MSTLHDNENNDQDSFDKAGMMPIHVIAISGRQDAVEILELMLQKGIDVNSRTRGDMDTILHLVVERCDVRHVFPLVLKIMEFNPDLKLRNRSLRTPYDIALAKEYYELASILDGSMTAMEANAFYKQSVGTVYGTKLIRAVLDSNEELITDFTKFGADANMLNEHGNGAIHYAITHCTISPLRTLPLLLNAGADTNLRDAEGDTALNLAIKSEKLHENGELPKIVDLLLDRGALSTYKDLDGNDALALAQNKGYNDIITLLKRDRTQHLQDKTREQEEISDSLRRKVQTPLYNTRTDEKPLTVEVRKEEDTPKLETEATEEVLEQPKHTRQIPRSDNPQEYLIQAVLEGTADDVQDALGDSNVKVKSYDENGLAILHHIINRDDGISDTDRQRIMELLIAAGADINAQTRKDKNTPLHLAASVNQVCSIEVLLKHKARYQLTNLIQYTPLKVAEYNEHDEARQMLEEHAKKEKQRMVEASRNSGACAIV
ncbi:hypothetical protein ACJMK2_015785 [Sinanodonta woodiana]|uniref:Uncharacterized protein n=1 Tax=Sinanodonta woodiana TaxID=1069815 RepID=A0ABD3URH0_SINWO